MFDLTLTEAILYFLAGYGTYHVLDALLLSWRQR